MTSVKVYDPAVCCSTGVCGPDADATIAQFAAALDKAKKSGVAVDRFTLAHQPGEYVKNTAVKGLLDSEGVDCLPIVFVGDEIVSKGDYPTGAALFAKLGMEADSSDTAPAEACCAPAEKTSSGCCS
jgi:hypothetical protein